MIKPISYIFMSAGLWLAVAMPSLAAERFSLEPLQGKWSVTKTNQEGRRFSQSMEISKDHMIFRLFGGDEQLRFIAKGKIKAEKAGPLDVLIISDLEGGRSEEDLKPVDDTRTLVYTLREEKLITASNFDKERDNEKPSIDSYTRVESGRASASDFETDEGKLLGTWKAEVTYGDRTVDYTLRIDKADGKLAATWVSPRSGDHKCKSITFKNGNLGMEMDREFQGNEVTVIYRGKLTAEGLSGTVVAKGYDEFNGTWKASK